ncbi:redoxin domain-containing protein [bacterium]|nr:redoxin domain-containing protein [bacterium]
MTDEHHQISGRTVAIAIGTTMFVGLVVLAINFDPSSDASMEEVPQVDALPSGTASGLQLLEAGYLTVGDKAPPLRAARWTTETPAAAQSYDGRLTVVDLWADWCPYARQLSPGLIQMRDEFRDAPVEFVSLTVGSGPPTGQAERGWLNGYDPGESLLPFRCLFRDVTYGLTVHPTLYLIGPDGRILWCDEGLREHHAEDHEVELAVHSALTKALAAVNSPTASDIPPGSSNDSDRRNQKPTGLARQGNHAESGAE